MVEIGRNRTINQISANTERRTRAATSMFTNNATANNATAVPNVEPAAIVAASPGATGVEPTTAVTTSPPVEHATAHSVRNSNAVASLVNDDVDMDQPVLSSTPPRFGPPRGKPRQQSSEKPTTGAADRGLSAKRPAQALGANSTHVRQGDGNATITSDHGNLFLLLSFILYLVILIDNIMHITPQSPSA